jgi:hypothetical protein
VMEPEKSWYPQEQFNFSWSSSLSKWFWPATNSLGTLKCVLEEIVPTCKGDSAVRQIEQILCWLELLLFSVWFRDSFLSSAAFSFHFSVWHWALSFFFYNLLSSLFFAALSNSLIELFFKALLFSTVLALEDSSYAGDRCGIDLLLNFLNRTVYYVGWL